LLVNRHQHLGGILFERLGVWDTLWKGGGSPIYDELRAALFDRYPAYGRFFPQYRDALPGKSGHSTPLRTHVAEEIINRW